MKINALILTNSDNVATLLENADSGDTVAVFDTAGNMRDELIAESAIPRGHKIALKDIGLKESIVKYGYQIGLASVEIRRGSYIHTHNLESARGRGDL